VPIVIDLLKNCPRHIPRLAKIWYEGLGADWVPGLSLRYVEQCLHERLHVDVLPITFVALDGKKPVGMCSLRNNDGIRLDLAPWLASLVVCTTYQKRGIGSQLIEAVKQKAAAMGFEKIYLFALDDTVVDWYARMGWKTIGTDIFKEHAVTVMEFDLRSGV
jgi:GNAT superfamily N-acetyltransferase